MSHPGPPTPPPPPPTSPLPTGPIGPELLRLARTAIAASLEDRPAPATPPPSTEPRLAAQAGVFVTLRTATGTLRGCIGTLRPRSPSMAEETWRMAREAAFADSRFPPVTRRELPELSIEISVLHPLQHVDDPARLDPRLDGIVVTAADGRRGALLPDVEGIDTVARQIEVARRKAGIGPRESIELQRFTVDKYHDAPPPRHDARARTTP